MSARMVMCMGTALLAGACDNVCNEVPIDGEARATATASGTVQLQQGAAPSSAQFSTAPIGEPASASFTGIVTDDTSRAVRFSIDTTDTPVSVFIEGDLPDLRAQQAPTTLSVAVDGSAGNCNFTAAATLTLTHAVGGGAPSPDFVTSDFLRTADLTIENVTFAANSSACPSLFAVRAALELTPASYMPVFETENCPDLSR